jgi:hypothetical protein
MLAIHKAITDLGGNIGTEIASGEVAALLPKITLVNQNDGVTIYRKFYLKNTNTRAEVGVMSLESATPFTAILFESTGDAQVVGDLTGTEVNGSPISFDIAVGAHASYWLKVTVPALSAETVNYEKINLKLTY